MLHRGQEVEAFRRLFQHRVVVSMVEIRGRRLFLTARDRVLQRSRNGRFCLAGHEAVTVVLATQIVSEWVGRETQERDDEKRGPAPPSSAVATRA